MGKVNYQPLRYNDRNWLSNGVNYAVNGLNNWFHGRQWEAQKNTFGVDPNSIIGKTKDGHIMQLQGNKEVVTSAMANPNNSIALGANSTNLPGLSNIKIGSPEFNKMAPQMQQAVLNGQFSGRENWHSVGLGLSEANDITGQQRTTWLGDAVNLAQTGFNAYQSWESLQMAKEQLAATKRHNNNQIKITEANWKKNKADYLQDVANRRYTEDIAGNSAGSVGVANASALRRRKIDKLTDKFIPDSINLEKDY